MRTLKLQSPPMTGSDVSAWQQFLADQSLYNDAIDGIYGPRTAQGTRDYQTSKGLGADGGAGPQTFAQAVLDRFDSPAGRRALPGVDAGGRCTALASCTA